MEGVDASSGQCHARPGFVAIRQMASRGEQGRSLGGMVKVLVAHFLADAAISLGVTPD